MLCCGVCNLSREQGVAGCSEGWIWVHRRQFPSCLSDCSLIQARIQVPLAFADGLRVEREGWLGWWEEGDMKEEKGVGMLAAVQGETSGLAVRRSPVVTWHRLEPVTSFWKPQLP